MTLDASQQPGCSRVWVHEYGEERSNGHHDRAVSYAGGSKVGWIGYLKSGIVCQTCVVVGMCFPIHAFAGSPDTLFPCKKGIEQVTYVSSSSNRVLGASPDIFIVESGDEVEGELGYLKQMKGVMDKRHTFAQLSHVWDAQAQLNQRHFTERRFITFDQNTQKTLPFVYRSLPQHIQSIFDKRPYSQQVDGLGVNRVNYIRGERYFETHAIGHPAFLFRERGGLFASALNSTPVYWGTPKRAESQDSYAYFYEEQKNRDARIFLNTHDGLLHVFSAYSGQEDFAYIPSPFLSTLHEKTDRAYSVHSGRVGKITLEDVWLDDHWKTVLVSGMGSYQEGIFALDVTQHNVSAMTPTVLFEFTSQQDKDVGQVVSMPRIVKLKHTSELSGMIHSQYFILFMSQKKIDHTWRTHLFLLDLNKSREAPWALNVNYYKVPFFQADDVTSPGLAKNKMGDLSYAYWGDTGGKVWRVDFTKASLAHLTSQVIFRAVDVNYHAQPIRYSPQVVFAPGGGHWIIFGTGNHDVGIQHNRLYALHDRLSLGPATIDMNRLVARYIESITKEGRVVYRIQSEQTGAALASSGWYLEWAENERSLSESKVVDGILFFDTFTPNKTSCEGQVNTYQLNLSTNASFSEHNEIVGLLFKQAQPISPIMMPLPPIVNKRNSLGQYTTKQPYAVLSTPTNLFMQHNQLSVEIQKWDGLSTVSGRLSWREIANWQDKQGGSP